MTSTRDPRSLLPLTPVAFEILLTVSDGDCHGYQIMQAVDSRTDGAIVLHPGTLYRALARLLDASLIEELTAEQQRPADDDERRRYYRLTKFGREVLTAEAERLARQVREARARRLVRS